MTVSKERKQLLKEELHKLITETREEVLDLVIKIQDFIYNNIGGTKP
jgi:hypothetical protein